MFQGCRHLAILGIHAITTPCQQRSALRYMSVCVGVSEYTPYDVVQQSASTYTSLVCWCVDTLASMHRQRATYSLRVVHRCLVQYYMSLGVVHAVLCCRVCRRSSPPYIAK